MQKVTIVFSKPMQIPKNVTVLQMMRSITFWIQHAETGRILDLVTGWSVVSFSGSTLVLQLSIDKLNLISTKKVRLSRRS